MVKMQSLWAWESLSLLQLVHGFLYNNRPKSTRSKRELDNDFVEVPYKQPFLEMFDDLSYLLNSNPPGTTDLDVVEIYKMTSLATREEKTAFFVIIQQKLIS